MPNETANAKNSSSIALITRNPSDLPDWVADAAEKAGLYLTVRRCENRDELLRYAGEAEIIWTVGANTCLSADILPSLPRCRAIMRSGSGLDDLPVEVAKARGIMVANTPEAIAETVAEHAVALILALVRRVAHFDRVVRAGEWPSGPNPGLGHLTGRTLGLVGFGLIAQHTARMLSGFRPRLLVYDPFVSEETLRKNGATGVSLETLLCQADVVSLHCPLTPETRGLIDADKLALMKVGALLVNTSRGGVIDELALVSALRNEQIAGAALDVLEPEPPAAEHPLFGMDNVILSPHIGAFSDIFEERFWQASLQKLKELNDILNY